MGNVKQPVETKKRKKKGRPSLLDLQKRSLRLQKQQEQQQPRALSNRNPNPKSAPAPNPYLKHPGRRSTRRNRSPNSGGEDDEEEDSNGKRKEKELKLVLRIPNGGSDSGERGSDSGADSGGSRKKRRIDAVETARQNSSSKVTEEAPQADPSDSGPTTPLPDKKLLVFILDRLQKKDTYAVFSEPVDPEELPDYHDIIKHPMDFATIRKKLDSGAYENLEQFESDVFLICSNAMRYNAPDTIYFRQARSIQELAKKDFENLRQESDDNEQEPMTARRGRPPIKHVMKRIGRAPADRTGSDFSSDATLANARDGIHSSNLARDTLMRGSSLDKSSIMDLHGGNNQHRSDRNEAYSGSPLKGIPMRNWKKFSTIDENRRNTYNQPLQSTCVHEPSVLTAFEGERKLLVPVGLYMGNAYARSLARFAANLGLVGWEIAAKRIQRVLPPGTGFGPGWVGDGEAASHKVQPPLPAPLPNPASQAKLPHGDTVSGGDKLLESHDPSSKSSTALPRSASASDATMTTSKPVDSTSSSESGRTVKHEGEHGISGGDMRPRSPLPRTVNGFNPWHGFNLPSHASRMGPHTRPSEAAMSHSHALDMVSRSGGGNNSFGSHQAPYTQPDAGDASSLASGNASAMNPGSSPPDASRKSEGQHRPPDLNVGFRSPGSPAAGVLADSKQPPPPDLALQL